MYNSTEQIEINQSIFSPDSLGDGIQDTAAAIKRYKKALADAQEKLDEKFKAQAPIHLLIYGRAWLIDQILSHAWYNLIPPINKDLCLVAVGGYGRGQLHPHSDIDLLILYRGNTVRKYEEEIKQFLTFLWDIGLQVGHSVRSIKQCRDEAKNDITVATSILESRTIAGHDHLLLQMRKKVLSPRIWPTPQFFAAKRDEQIERHNKYQDTEYNLEPNVKESPGGLRDLQIIGWVTKRHFDTAYLKELVAHNFLNENEFQLLTGARDYLWTIRYGLHMITGRAEDRLLFDHQRTLAQLFGYEDTEESLAVEQLMQRFYRAVIRVVELNDMLLQHFDEAIVRAKEKPVTQPLNARFKITNDYIEVVDAKVFLRSPFALLEVFLLMAQHPEIQGVRATTIRLIRDHRHLIDDKFRADIRNTSIFMELMRTPNGLVTQLQRMRRYGILGHYLPEFGNIIGKMQHDLFHIYTVDAHTLMLLQNIEHIYNQQGLDRFPLAGKIIKQIPKIELLYMAALYHDIAKGRGGDHSELGAVDAREFCQRHHLSKWDTELVAWLVESHLIMSMTAQRKDISDPAVVQDFAKLMQDQLHLDYLFLLTVVDIIATNPTLWNSWRASLMGQLYMETKRALSRGLENPIDKQNTIADKQQEALQNLPYNPVVVSTLWQQLGDDYFIQHNADDIARHTRAILEHTEPGTPLVLIEKIGSQQSHMGASQIFIYTQSGAHLFAATAGALEQLNLNILDARISTSPSNFNLNSYVVLEDNGTPLGDNAERIEQIKASLINALQAPEQNPFLNQKRTPRRLRHFTMPTEVSIYNEAQSPYTAVEVITPDRPGLLALIGYIFVNHELVLRKAKIATLGERVEDVFFITDKELNPIVDENIHAALKQEICEQLDTWSQQPEKAAHA